MLHNGIFGLEGSSLLTFARDVVRPNRTRIRLHAGQSDCVTIAFCHSCGQTVSKVRFWHKYIVIAMTGEGLGRPRNDKWPKRDRT